MPIPLLAIPIAAGFAAAGGGVSIGTLVGSIFGGVAGGAALGGGGYWLYSRNKQQPSQQHQESLNRQAEITRQRIKKTRKAVEKIPPQLSKVAEAVHEASSTTQKAVTQLNETAIELHETGTALNTATQNAKEAVGALNQNTFESVAPQLQEALAELEALSLQLKEKEEELYNAQECIEKLQKALIAQIKLGEQLDSTC